jgi:hypothetical protein
MGAIVDDENGKSVKSDSWKSSGFRNPGVQAEYEFLVFRKANFSRKLKPSGRDQLIIRDRKTVSAANPSFPLQGSIDFSTPQKPVSKVSVNLGHLIYEKEGSLVFLGGDGISGQVGDAPLTDDFNTPGWWDNTSDGRIDVTVTIGGRKCTCFSFKFFVKF